MFRLRYLSSWQKTACYPDNPYFASYFLSFPDILVEESVVANQSDRYYKMMMAYKQFFLFYGVAKRSKSLNNLCKNQLLPEDKLTYLGINQSSVVSTLSDRKSTEVVKLLPLYQKLLEHNREVLRPCLCHFIERPDSDKVFRFHSSTITLLVDLFKRTGRNTPKGKKKRGLKIHSKMPYYGSHSVTQHVKYVR